jgi:hypothetical protein
VLVYALLYEEVDEMPNKQAKQVPGTATASVPFSQEATRIADALLGSLLRYPRGYLTLRVGSLLARQ